MVSNILSFCVLFLSAKTPKLLPFCFLIDNYTHLPSFSFLFTSRIDIQIGSVRLSYQDARSVYQYEDPNSEWAIQTSKRWHEILSEKPDLFVVPIYSNGSLEYSQVVQAAADTNYEGLVAFSPQKKHILGGGISVTYSKETALSAPERAVDTLSNVFHDCSDCDHLDRRHFFISDGKFFYCNALNQLRSTPYHFTI